MKTQNHDQRSSKFLNIRYLVLYFLLLFYCSVSAQSFNDNTCRVEEQMQKLYDANPNSKNESKSLRSKVPLMKNNQKAAPYVVPVVFHVFGTAYNNGSTVNRAIIEDALQKTNEDFQGLNADYTTIDAPFDVIKQPLDVTFKLAQLDPNGNPTTGIIYYDKASGMGNYGSPVVAQVAWDNYKYCNVYITRDLYGDGDFYNSGVAWYPDNSMSAANIARVVYNGSFLGNNTNENFRSVLTHEFGHYFDLPHTFDKGVCNNDPNDGDGVADTPSQKNNSSGTNCEVIQNCLNQEINNENFMDYTDCYKMFTQGQVSRMINALDNSPARNTLWTNNNLIATGLASDLGARIATSGVLFEERFLNDGIVENSIKITCEDCSFTKSSGNMVLNTDYTVANLPPGLSARIVINNSTSATIHLDNTATNHNLADSVTNLSFTFLNAIVSGGVGSLYKDSLDNLKVSFKDVYTEYCNTNISYAVYAHITNVEFDGRTNPTGYDGNSNYIQNLVYPAKKGNTYPIKITTNKGNGGAGDNVRIQGWFDWDNDFIYDENELVISHSYSNGNIDANGDYSYSTNITIPANTVLGNTAFRILAHYVQNNDGDTACGSIDSGESEDYGLNIIDQNATFKMEFSGNPTKVNFSEAIAFSDLTVTDNGDSVTAWSWTFEGGVPASSTDRNPTSIIFPEGGTYDVSLEVTTANGINQTLTKTDYITSELNYCDSGPKFGGYFNVNHVTLETIDHDPLKSRAGDYYDTVFTTLTPGETYPITIKTERGNGGAGDVNRVRVWADWNFDSAFSENELVVTQVVKNEDYINDEYSFTANITVPGNAAIGKKIGFRVVGHFVKGAEGDTACGDYDSGNTADYGIIIAGTSPTCNDGIQNGDETGIDCGGSCAPCDVEPTCDDGIQNGDETGIDCGGSCAPCDVEPTCDDGIQNGDETGIDCGGSCAPCDTTDTYCDASNQDGSTHITRVTFGNIDNSSAHNPYSDYTNLSTTFATGDQLSLTVNTTNEHWTYNALGAWIDWNNDRDFDDAGEEILHIYGPGPYSTTATVPSSAIKGAQLRMRVRMGYGSEDKITPCGNDTYLGEVEDYSLIITNSNTNIPPIVQVTSPQNGAEFSSGDTVTLTANASDEDGNITMVEFFEGSTKLGEDTSAPYSITWSSIANGDYVLTAKATDNKGSTSTSSAINISVISPRPNYCAANAQNGVEAISNVSFGSINNASERSSTGYENYISQIADVVKGSDYNLVVDITPYSDGTDNEIYAWFDWNRNGDFGDTGEYILITKTSGTKGEATITIPTNADLGATGMRIRVAYYSASNIPCGSVQYGEVEDYTLNISDSGRINFNATSNNLNQPMNITVYPNPNSGNGFEINFGSSETGIAQIKLYNTIGVKVYELNEIKGSELVKKIKMDQELASGLYILQVRIGSITKTTRIVVE